ncbi:MAG: DUF4397 domain-containing protein [Bacteroidota bacterium]|nr:MAG: DUF4397 domain-containing protein [Bacteroidota bacterium]
MKKFTLIMATSLLVIGSAFAQTARVQVIHNSADAAADSVDVYLNNTLLLDNFAFRNATSFIDAPAGSPISIDIAPKTSSSATESIYNLTTTLSAGEKYILVANGIVSASGYSPATAFNIYVNAMGRESASNSANTDLLVFHGATDAPTVDVYEATGPANLVNDLAYGSFAGYLELPTADYYLQVRDASGTVNVAAYNAPLATLGLDGAAAVVVASGFLNLANNSDGPAFGLYVALPSGGELVALPQTTTRVQVIHNSADAAADSVDVYLNDGLLIDNFAFRTASSFIDAPANTEISIDIAPKGSASSAESIYNLTTTLDPQDTYVLVASGIVSASGYSPATAFDIDVYAMGREEASNSANTDLLVYHGSTDAPTVDVFEATGPANLANDLAYGNFAGYLELPTADYYLQVRDASGTVNVAAYNAPLATLGLDGAAAVVVASGFLNPANNSDGPAFGLYVALPTGGNLVALPKSTARVQVIHNSADAAADSVDVYLNDALLLNNFAFRNASPFINAPANTEISIDIAPASSTSASESIYNLTATLDPRNSYVLMASGIVSGTGYSPATPFAINVYDMGMETAMGDTTAVLVYHGATDAPAVDVVETRAGAGTIVDNIAYGDFAGYLMLPTADYTIDIRDETGATTVATYLAPLANLSLNGQGIVVFASGFLTPSNNSDGPAFGLFAATAGGAVVELPSASETAYATFSVDMSYWAATERFDPMTDSVDIAGSFNEWATNYTGLDKGVDNIYSVTLPLATDVVHEYKYRINNSWDDDKSEFPSGGANRTVEIMGDTVLATVFFNDETFTARVQVIHNSADAAAAEVDVYLNGGLLIDNFAFRTASSFIDAPANSEISIDIAPASSTSASESIYNLTTTLDWNANYVLVANGIVSATGYSPAQAFDIYVHATAREEASEAANTDLLVFHGSTDAPVVDIYEATGPGELVNNLAYGTFAGYLELPTADYVIELRDEAGTTKIQRYDAPLETLGLDGAAITVVASGFLTPANNSNGAAFGLWVALAAGGDLVELPVSNYTSVNTPSGNALSSMVYPNPASKELTVEFDSEYQGFVTVKVVGITGQTLILL